MRVEQVEVREVHIPDMLKLSASELPFMTCVVHTVKAWNIDGLHLSYSALDS